MESKIIKFMIDHQYLKTNCIINATFSAPGVEDCAQTPKGKIYVKGCDPENLREYIVGASKVHQLNGMDQTTIERLYPEMP